MPLLLGKTVFYNLQGPISSVLTAHFGLGISPKTEPTITLEISGCPSLLPLGGCAGGSSRTRLALTESDVKNQEQVTAARQAWTSSPPTRTPTPTVNPLNKGLKLPLSLHIDHRPWACREFEGCCRAVCKKLSDFLRRSSTPGPERAKVA